MFLNLFCCLFSFREQCVFYMSTWFSCAGETFVTDRDAHDGDVDLIKKSFLRWRSRQKETLPGMGDS